MTFNVYLRLFFCLFIWSDYGGKNFNEAPLKGLSGEMPDIVLVKRAPPPKNAYSKVCTLVRSGLV